MQNTSKDVFWCKVPEKNK